MSNETLHYAVVMLIMSECRGPKGEVPLGDQTYATAIGKAWT